MMMIGWYCQCVCRTNNKALMEHEPIIIIIIIISAEEE
jgi:hypothetical protein